MKVKAKKGIIVCRVSTKDQAEDAHFSLAVQKKSILEYASANDFEIIGQPRQIIESAHKGKRQKFVSVLEELQRLWEDREEPIALLLYDVSRFSRDSTGEAVVKTDRMREEGKVELHFVSDNAIYHQDSRAGEMRAWRNAVSDAQYDSDKKSEKVKDVIAFKLGKGEYPSVAPVGYLNIIEGYKSGEIKKKIVIDTPRAKLIKEAFKLYAEDSYSLEELARVMKNKGLTVKAKRTKHNPDGEAKPISKAGLLHVLRNPFYSGKFWFTNPNTKKRELWKATSYEPLITEELFEKVQKILSRKAVQYSTHHYSSTKFFKFRGLLTCAFCGCVMTPTDMKKNFKGKASGSGVYYRCTYGKKNSDPDWYKNKFGSSGHSGVSRYKGKKVVNCPQLLVREEQIDGDIKDNLRVLHYDEKVFKELKAALRREHESRMSIVQIEKQNLEKEIDQKQNLIRGMIRMQALDSSFEQISEFKEELLRARDEVDTLKDKLQEVEESIDIDIDSFVDTLAMCSNLSEQYDTLPDHKKRELVMIAFSGISVRKGTANGVSSDSCAFNWNEPFQTLLEQGLDKIIKEGGDYVPGFPSGKGNPIIKTNLRDPDEVGR